MQIVRSTGKERMQLNSWVLSPLQKRTTIHHHTPESQPTPVRREERTVSLLPPETVVHGG